MHRFALKLEYDGRPFSGWQRQRNGRSVQQSLEEALRRLDPETPPVVGAGRTDSGVHATGQVAHCDFRKAWEPDRLKAAINAHLRPDPVSVLRAAAVGGDFSARFSAVERTYLYKLVCRRAPLALKAGLAWRVPSELDGAAMREGASHLVGRHDFTTFRSVHCQADSPVKTLDCARVDWKEGPDGTDFVFLFRARSFLHRQVRSFVGTLERVGARAWSPGEVAEALLACDRAGCGPVAPPDGLYLSGVRYEPDPFGCTTDRRRQAGAAGSASAAPMAD